MLVLAVMTPTLVGLAASPYVNEPAILAVYFPAIMLAAVLLGWRLGLIATALSILAACYLTVRQIPGPSAADIASAVYFFAAAALIVLFANTLRRTLVELDATARREAVLAAELGHRSKNNLQIIGSLARQTQQSGKGEDSFFQALTARLEALACAQDLLRRSDWQGCALPALAREALRPFSDHPGLSIEGPDCALPAEVCTPLVLAFHELGTNASKYGALSCPDGRVEVRWSVQRDGRLRLRWRERDGPPVKEPERRGLGSRLLADSNPLIHIEHLFNGDGVRCEISVDGVRTD